MIKLDCTPGSEQWFKARLGIPTASNFDRIITPKTMKMSESSSKYAHELIAEQILGIHLESVSTGFTQRGQVMEKKAIDYYELTRDCDVEPGAFVMRDDRRTGCTPDGFVGDNGIIEIKCPSAAIHVGYLLDDAGIGYRAQVQGQLWLTEREYCDTISYNPDMPSVIVRQNRDDIFIVALEKAVNQFIETIADMKDRLIRRGLIKPEQFNAAQLAADQEAFTMQWGGKLARDLHHQEATA